MIPTRSHHADRRYDHRYHAGNAADVWKHAALLAWLGVPRVRPCTVVEVHAGAGTHKVEPNGEWTEGLLPVLVAPHEAPAAVRRLQDQSAYRHVRAGRGGLRTVLGSPVLALQSLGTADRLVAFELDLGAATALSAAFKQDPRAKAVHGNGWLGTLTEAEAAGPGRDVLIHVDPPYADRQDWEDASAIVDRILAVRPDAGVLVWYPIKGRSRPAKLRAALGGIAKARGVSVVCGELSHRLADPDDGQMRGSGVALVGAPWQALDELASAALWLGRAMAQPVGGPFSVVWQALDGGTAHDAPADDAPADDRHST